MSEELAALAFGSWLRRGVAAHIARIDGTGGGTGGPAARAPLSIAIGFENDPALSAPVELAIHGPGDVVALDAKVVIRTWPRPDVRDAESNFFPLIELDQPDFPWRFTPASATAADRLRPWLALVVLEDGEIERVEQPGGKQRCPVITVRDATPLPDLAQSWGWAHVQVSGRKDLDPDAARAILRGSPHDLISRLLCPRRMKPDTRYGAYLVPALEPARRAGAGEPADPAIDGLAPAWQAGAAHLRLPVYYQWRFTTGDLGDFKSLVRRLRPRKLSPDVGTRDLDASAPGQALPPAALQPLALQSALRSPQTLPREWPAAERDAWVAALDPLLDLPAQLLAAPGALRVVAPPLYGDRYALRDTIAPSAPPWPWPLELNQDPRRRVAAGLGTRVVQDERRPLLASAWDQVARVREINEKLRQAQLARELAARLHLRMVVPRDPSSVIAWSAQLHTRLLAAAPAGAPAPQTIAARLAGSPIPPGALEPQLRRVMRPMGPIRQRQLAAARALIAAGVPAPAPPPPLLERLDRGELVAAGPPPLPSTMATPARAGAGIAPSWLPPGLAALLLQIAPWRAVLLGLAVALAGVLLLLIGDAILLALALLAPGAGLAALAAFAPGRLQGVLRRAALRDGTLDGDLLRTAPLPAGFVPQPAPPPGAPVPPPPPLPPAVRAQAAARLQAAAAAAFDAIAAPPAPGPVLRAVALPALGARIAAAIDPRTTVAAAIGARLKTLPGVLRSLADPLEPVLAGPDFPQPMYQPLKEESQDWILAGLDRVPPETISLCLTNETFVEAYMVGCNHELGRLLVWNEYPTDRRYTYFRQFWDVRGYTPPAGQTFDPEQLRDIQQIHTWPAGSALGQHSPRPLPPGGESVVLLVKGELLRRYPNAIIYAAKAKLVAGGKHELTDEHQDPILSGTLDPDVRFFGFALSADEVKGVPGSATQPGWFFVIQEHPSEPRFGVDIEEGLRIPLTAIALGPRLTAPDRALSVARAALPGGGGGGGGGGGVPPGGSFDPTRFGDRAAKVADATLRQPVRVAVHAANMID